MNRIWPNKEDAFHLHEDWRVILAAFATIAGAIGGIAGLTLPAVPTLLMVSIVGYFLGRFLAKKAIDPHPFIIALGLSVLSFLLGMQHLQQLPAVSIMSEQFTQLGGKVINIEDRVERPLRVTILVNEKSNLQWLRGQQVRLNVRTQVPEGLLVGCEILVDAVLAPLTGPVVPGGYDFGRQAHIAGIGAQGFAAGLIQLVNQPCEQNATIAMMRQRMSAQIHSIMPDSVAGVAVALITGDRSGIDTKTRTTLRDAGLSHLLAISGLHMGLVTGAAFFALELIFAGLMPGKSHIPARKLAAIGAFFAALAYLLISGAGIATTRAFIMVSIGLLAILTDRRVISLRSLSFAAIALVLMSPQIVVSISFQLSFAATAALVMVYERISRGRPRGSRAGKPKVLRPKLVIYFLGVAASSLVAQLAIAPLALYHFQSISVLGATANLLAIPIMAFIVMPSALLGSLLMPVGADFVFWPMEQGLNAILSIADYTGRLPASSISAPPINPVFLPIVLIGFFVASIFREKLWLVIALASVAVAMFTLFQQPADILLAGARPTIGYVGSDKTFFYNGSSRSSFRADAWRQYWGLESTTKPIKPNRTCANETCVIDLDIKTHKTERLVVTEDIETLRHACSGGHLVVSTFRYKPFCKGEKLFISKEDLVRFGPAGLWIEENSTPIVKWSKHNPFE